MVCVCKERSLFYVTDNGLIIFHFQIQKLKECHCEGLLFWIFTIHCFVSTSAIKSVLSCLLIRWVFTVVCLGRFS